jgi:uncharacterized alkaline shock family protein YloU
MSLKQSNDYGDILIDNEVIASIAGISTTECCGIAGMAAKNVKDGIVHMLRKDSVTKGVKLSIKGNTIIIDLHIIVEYGTNIFAVADTIISNVKYKVEESVGLSVGQVNIFVDGVRV